MDPKTNTELPILYACGAGVTLNSLERAVLDTNGIRSINESSGAIQEWMLGYEDFFRVCEDERVWARADAETDKPRAKEGYENLVKNIRDHKNDHTIAACGLEAAIEQLTYCIGTFGKERLPSLLVARNRLVLQRARAHTRADEFSAYLDQILLEYQNIFGEEAA